MKKFSFLKPNKYHPDGKTERSTSMGTNGYLIIKNQPQIKSKESGTLILLL